MTQAHPLINTMIRGAGFVRLLLLMWAHISVWNSNAVEPNAEATALGYRTDQFLVRLRQDTTTKVLTEFHQRQGCRVLQDSGAEGKLEVLAVPEGGEVKSLVAAYKASGLVDYAEPDYFRYTTLTSPNDPMYVDGTLWALNNYGQNGGKTHSDIEAPEAWDVLTSASNIVVAVLDTGILYTHEDLAENMWVNPVDGGHGTNSFAGTPDPKDDEGHGTLMAGVIGGVGNNGKGVAGVAWKVQLMACKCFNSAQISSDSALIAAIDYARENGARVINASFDSTNFGISLSNAIYRASQDGVLFVSSCGNNRANVDVTPHYPACFQIDNIISVAYTTRNDDLGQFSNYGTNVLLAAPGAGIYSCFFTSDAAYLGSPFLEGTSYAAAYVSGAAAMVLAKYPGEPYQQTIVRLLNGTDPIPALAGRCKTGGRLNLWYALAPRSRLVLRPSVTPGSLKFQVVSGPARSCVVESSTDLGHWSPILTNLTSSAGLFDFDVSSSVSSSSQFYRTTDLP